MHLTPSQSRDLSLVFWLFCGGLLIIAIVHSFQPTQEKDFVYFYGDGTLVNQHKPLYDYDIQRRVFESISSAHSGTYGPSPYPPFVHLGFALLARLPLGVAYHVWMVVTMLLYVAALLLLLPRGYLSAALPLALSCWLFMGRILFKWSIVGDCILCHCSRHA